MELCECELPHVDCSHFEIMLTQASYLSPVYIQKHILAPMCFISHRLLKQVTQGRKCHRHLKKMTKVCISICIHMSCRLGFSCSVTQHKHLYKLQVESRLKYYSISTNLLVSVLVQFEYSVADSEIGQPVDSCLLILDLQQGCNSTMKQRSQEIHYILSSTNDLFACDLFCIYTIIS